MSFTLTLTSVGILLLYAIPGFILSKTKAVKTDVLPALSKILMYVCQPCLTLYTFNDVEFSLDLLKDLALFFIIITILQLLFIGLFYLVLRKKQEDVKFRVFTIASTFGNCGFFGVPILESLLPGTNAVVFSNMYVASMNVIGWTVASAIISRDKKYISIKKIIINPATIMIFVAMLLFIFNIKMPNLIYTPLNLLGRMSAPLCMIILGIRLGVSPFKRVFLQKMPYLIVVIKQMIFPLTGLLLSFILPFDYYIKQALFILMCCPVASVVLNFSELIGQGQEEAANILLLGTLLSILTMPIMLLLI